MRPTFRQPIRFGEPKKRSVRIDDLLVERGLAENIKHARSLILAGKIVTHDQRVDKPGQKFSESITLRVKNQKKWVSRSGQKLYDAIQDLQLSADFQQKTVLDIGSSTGGFTQCLLEKGVRKVHSVDVGTNQMAWNIRQDPRVELHEQTDIRSYQPTEKIDWVTGDVSFISLTTILPAIAKIAPQAQWLLLVKPQFEVAKKDIPTGGIITDNKMKEEASENMKNI